MHRGPQAPRPALGRELLAQWRASAEAAAEDAGRQGAAFLAAAYARGLAAGADESPPPPPPPRSPSPVRLTARSPSRSPRRPIVRLREPLVNTRTPSQRDFARWDERRTDWEAKPGSERRQRRAREALFRICPRPIRERTDTVVCGLDGCLESSGRPGFAQGQCPLGACGRCCRKSPLSALCLHPHSSGPDASGPH